MLAESWELSSDNKQLKLNLRKGVQFHSGREFTSEDVKWNVMWVRDPKVAAGALIQQSRWFSDVETPDKYTAILVSDQPRPAAFDFFEFFNIVDSVTAEGPERDRKLVGTGPFIQTEWVQGDHLSFERNPNYWQTGSAVPGFDPRQHRARPAVGGVVAGSRRHRHRRHATPGRLRSPANRSALPSA